MRPSDVLRLVAVTTFATACSDSSIAPFAHIEPSLAKGGPGTQKVDFTISDVGTSLRSDGKGLYPNGVCGVVGTWSTILFLAPAGASIPRSQQAACAGIAPRAVTLVLVVRHLSDSPHVDDGQAPAGSGSFAVQNVKFGFGTAYATTINAAPSCGTIGLRFSPVTYPGTSDLVRVDLGGGQWHMYSQPWPNDVAYCANGSSVAYWHVVVDLRVQVDGS